MYGFHRVAMASPEMRVADVPGNITAIRNLAEAAFNGGAGVVLFPELSLTGYTCGDLFHQESLLTAAADGLRSLVEWSAGRSIMLVAGVPLRHGGALYNCAAVIQDGAVLGAVPKSFIPNYREYYEKRWFSSWRGRGIETMRLWDGFETPVGTNLIFDDGGGRRVAIEICEDMWAVNPPSCRHVLAGANLILNPSASDEQVAKAEYRRRLVSQQSARCVCAYAYVSSGPGESSTDLVFGGHAICAENGAVIAESERFAVNGSLSFADVDLAKMDSLRLTECSFADSLADFDPGSYRKIATPTPRPLPDIARFIDPHPFVPSNPAVRGERCREIFNIQKTGLATRLRHTGLERAVIGVSGGLDSTLALLATVAAFETAGHGSEAILAVTMPGFGTSDLTLSNAKELCRLLGVECREIGITAACELHFKDIGQNPAVHNVVYENCQARERTQILMDLANRENGLVIGTGDLSEIALGWSTYNGDHMSMYAVNCGVPKTLIKYLVEWMAAESGGELAAVLDSIIATPISPELLPNRAGSEISQRTESLIGPYELHDFFLYHFVKYGASPAKIAFLAEKAFAGHYTAKEIRSCLTTFVKRFFAQQFKRSCIPDGPKVGSICLSPRGDWRMPSDTAANVWLREIEKNPM